MSHDQIDTRILQQPRLTLTDVYADLVKGQVREVEAALAGSASSHVLALAATTGAEFVATLRYVAEHLAADGSEAQRRLYALADQTQAECVQLTASECVAILDEDLARGQGPAARRRRLGDRPL